MGAIDTVLQFSDSDAVFDDAVFVAYNPSTDETRRYDVLADMTPEDMKWFLDIAGDALTGITDDVIEEMVGLWNESKMEEWRALANKHGFGGIGMSLRNVDMGF